MKMPNFVYHRPQTLDEALELLSQHAGDAKVLAGGQSLIPVMALRLSQPAHLVDIGRVPGLATLAEGPEGEVAIGAMVRHEQVERSDLVARRAPLLALSAPFIGHPAIRSRGTTCGSLAHADPAAEMPAVAAATGAHLVVRSTAGERVLAAEDFFVSFLTTALAPDELLVEVRFPTWGPRTGGSVQEVSRRHGDFALVGLSCVLTLAENGTVEAAALSFFGVDSTPRRAAKAELGLIGQRLEDAVVEAAARQVSAELEPGDDIHATAAYRRHVAAELTRRGLQEAGRRAGGEA